MAIYGSQIEAGKSEQEALDAVATVIEKTSVLDDSARDSLQTFASGKGDVLIGYENEAIQAQDEGIELDYVLPDSTIKIENPGAVTTEAQDPEAAKAFLDFILTDEGQQIFADYGYRPVTESVLAAEHGQVPGGARPVHDRRFRRLGQGRRGVLQRRDRQGHGHPASAGCAARVEESEHRQ